MEGVEGVVLGQETSTALAVAALAITLAGILALFGFVWSLARVSRRSLEEAQAARREVAALREALRRGPPALPARFLAPPGRPPPPGPPMPTPGPEEAGRPPAPEVPAEGARTEAVAGLATALRDPDPFARVRAIQELGGSPGAEDLLIQALADESPPVRREAVRALRGSRTVAAMQALIEVVSRDPSSEVREEAVEVLGALLGEAAEGEARP